MQITRSKTQYLHTTILILVGVSAWVMSCGYPATADAYTDSAHGDPLHGVNRSGAVHDIGYCAHCHETFDPNVCGLNDVMLFAPMNLTSQTDNFCFQCHKDDESSVQIGGVTNYRYASTFGGYDTFHTSGIMGAFNQGSYHNLNDIRDFAKDNFSFFKDSSNPCVACHNPHLAKRNKEYPTDPSYTAISRPTDHNNLWGDSADNSEKMSKYTTYLPPYYDSTDTYEPGGPDMHDGSILPDYNSFCQDCHQYEVPSTQAASMNPNTTSGYLTAINWSSGGDMHGERPRIYDVDGTGNSRIGTIIAPYNVGTPPSNYVLSCLDCHEPHGTVLVSAVQTSSYLLRKEANNNVVDGCGPSSENFCEIDFCESCHTSDHCGGPQGCFQCHYHGAENIACEGSWTGPNF